MLAALKGGADCVVSDCRVTDQALHVTAPSFFAHVQLHESRWYNLLVRNFYLGCCMAFTRRVLRRALPFPTCTPMHDIWIGNVAAFTGRVEFLHEPLILFRRHGDNASCTARKSPYSLRAKIKFRLDVLFPLIARLCRRNAPAPRP